MVVAIVAEPKRKKTPAREPAGATDEPRQNRLRSSYEWPPETVVKRGSSPTTSIKIYTAHHAVISEMAQILDLKLQDALLLFYDVMKVELLKLMEERGAMLRGDHSEA